jgi:hypothetical protein
MGFVTLKTTDGRFITVHANSLPHGDQQNGQLNQRPTYTAIGQTGATGVGQGAEGAWPAGSERERCRYCGAPLRDP